MIILTGKLRALASEDKADFINNMKDSCGEYGENMKIQYLYVDSVTPSESIDGYSTYNIHWISTQYQVEPEEYYHFEQDIKAVDMNGKMETGSAMWGPFRPLNIFLVKF